MNIRRANEKDIKGINKLLCQVLMVHHNGRPDLFKADVKKYNVDDLMNDIDKKMYLDKEKRKQENMG